MAICLTETPGCHFFNRLRDEGPEWMGPFAKGQSWGSRCLEVRTFDAASLFIFPGQQIVTSERLEVLALVSEVDMPSGEETKVTLRRVQESGAFAVFPWSLGKWWGKRGEILNETIAVASAGDFALSDSSLRPWWLLPPSQFALAKERGLPILAGTDPFPQSGQEQLVGRYASYFSSGFDSAMPAESMLALLRSGKGSARGRRDSSLGQFLRLGRNICR
jgi:hypothetical protein